MVTSQTNRPMPCLWFVVLLLCLVATGAATWLNEVISFENGEAFPAHLARSVSLNVSESTVCALDRITISWKSSKTSNVDSLAIAIARISGSDASIVALSESVADEELSNEDGAQLIRCEDNIDHCFPKVGSISAQPENLKLVLQFDARTTQVELLDAMAVSDALHFSPALRLVDAHATWVAPDKLEIQVIKADIDTILIAHGRGEVIEIQPRTSPRIELRGSVTVRPTEPGDYQVVVVDRSAGMAVLSAAEAPAQLIHVQLCDDATVLPKLPSAHKLNIRQDSSTAGKGNQIGIDGPNVSARAKRTVQVQGPLAVTGQDPLKFAHDITDPLVKF